MGDFLEDATPASPLEAFGPTPSANRHLRAPLHVAKARISISAALDGEASDLEKAAVSAHLETCTSCREFQSQCSMLFRRMRVGAYDARSGDASTVLARLGLPDSTLDASDETEGLRAAGARQCLARATQWAAAIVPLGVAIPVLTTGSIRPLSRRTVPRPHAVHGAIRPSRPAALRAKHHARQWLFRNQTGAGSDKILDPCFCGSRRSARPFFGSEEFLISMSSGDFHLWPLVSSWCSNTSISIVVLCLSHRLRSVASRRSLSGEGEHDHFEGKSILHADQVTARRGHVCRRHTRGTWT